MTTITPAQRIAQLERDLKLALQLCRALHAALGHLIEPNDTLWLPAAAVAREILVDDIPGACPRCHGMGTVKHRGLVEPIPCSFCRPVQFAQTRNGKAQR